MKIEREKGEGHEAVDDIDDEDTVLQMREEERMHEREMDVSKLVDSSSKLQVVTR